LLNITSHSKRLDQMNRPTITDCTAYKSVVLKTQIKVTAKFQVLRECAGISDCNPGIDFSIPRCGIKKIVIPESRFRD